MDPQLTQPTAIPAVAGGAPGQAMPIVAPPPPPPPVASGPAATIAPASPPVAPIAPPQPVAITLSTDETAAGITVEDQRVVVPIAAYRSLLQSASDAGRREVESTVQDRISKLGFQDLADLLQQVESEIEQQAQEIIMATPGAPAATAPATPAAAITQPTAGAQPAPTAPLTAPPPTAGQPTPAQVAAAAADDPANDRRLPENLRKRVAQFRDQMRGRAETAETQARTHQERVTALEGELQAQRAAETMKIQMVQAGVKEIDFAWHSLSNELARLKADPSPEAKEKLKTFDVAAWATELRKTKPYLFGEQVVPATSPAPGAPAGAAPTPAAVTGGVTTPGADARNLPPDEFRKRMGELGVRYTGYSSPMKRG